MVASRLPVAVAPRGLDQLLDLGLVQMLPDA